jgi:CRP-like cAMP-binding protein
MYVKVSAQFCVFPIERFENMAMERADFAKAVITNVVGRFFFAINQLEHMTLDTSEEKILYTLGMLHARAGAHGGSASLAVTHKELAILAGVNRITATRVLEHLRKGDVVAPAGKNKPTNTPD